MGRNQDPVRHGRVRREGNCGDPLYDQISKKGSHPLLGAHKPCPEDSHYGESHIIRLLSQMQDATSERESER